MEGMLKRSKLSSIPPNLAPHVGLYFHSSSSTFKSHTHKYPNPVCYHIERDVLLVRVIKQWWELIKNLKAGMNFNLTYYSLIQVLVSVRTPVANE